MWLYGNEIGWVTYHCITIDVFVCILPAKAIPKMTYSTVSGGTLNPTHSLYDKLWENDCVL